MADDAPGASPADLSVRVVAADDGQGPGAGRGGRRPLRKGWADRDYLVDHAARLGIDLGIARLAPGGARGFTVQPRRWCVERTLGWLILNRRLARDYEALPARSTAMIYIAMIALMARRLTRIHPTW